MPGGKLAQRRRQGVALHECACRRLDQRQRRFHVVEIELGAAEVRMRLDPAIGDDQRPSIVRHRHVVGADAVAVELADAAIAIGRLIEADHPAVGLEIVLARIEQPAVRREAAMAEEVPVRAGVDDGRFRSASGVEEQGERSRAPREGRRMTCRRAMGHPVAARRQPDALDDRAVFGKRRKAKAAVAGHEAGGEHRIAPLQRK